MTPSYRYRFAVVRVIDGDTFIARVDLGFRVFHDVHVRVRGVDCPERGEEGWAESLEFTAHWLEERTGHLVLESHKDRQSFARWICDVWCDNTGMGGRVNLAAAVAEAGFGIKT